MTKKLTITDSPSSKENRRVPIDEKKNINTNLVYVFIDFFSMVQNLFFYLIKFIFTLILFNLIIFTNIV